MTKPKSEDDFLTILEKGVRDVLADENSTASEKIQAITAGSKLMQIKHKIKDPGEGQEHFFKKS